MTTRRQFLRNAALLGGAGWAASGCSSYVATGFTGAQTGSNRLAYWNLFTGGDGERMQEMLTAIDQKSPSLRVQDVTLEWGSPYYTKLSLATVADRPPDVAIMHLSRVPTFVRAGLLAELTPVAREPHGLTGDRFIPKAWEQSQVSGRVYAVPLDVHPYVLYYNTDICDRAGLLDSSGRLKPIEGRQDFTRALRAVKKSGAQWGGIVTVVADPSATFRLFWTLYAQAGGELVTDFGSRVVLDEETAADVLGFLRGLTAEDHLMPAHLDSDSAVAAFSEGKAGFFFNGPWEVTTMLDAKLPFSMTTFPQLYSARYATEADSHAFVVPAQPGDLGPALSFVRGMLDESLIWAKGGQLPAWLPLQESAEYRDLDPQSRYTEAARQAVYHPSAWYSGSGSNLEDVIGTAVATCLSGRLSPGAAARKMRRDLIELAGTSSPVT